MFGGEIFFHPSRSRSIRNQHQSNCKRRKNKFITPETKKKARMECEYCDKKATVEWEVQGYKPKKTPIVTKKHRYYPTYKMYLCDEHAEKGLGVFTISLPCIRKERKL